MLLTEHQVSRRFWLVCALISMLCLNVQAQSRSDRFADQVKRNCNAVCPYTDEIGVTCQKATYDGRDLHFYLIIPEALLMDMRPDQLKPFYADRLRFNFGINSYINPLYVEAAEVGAGLVYHVVVKENELHTFQIRYSPAELKQIMADRNTPPYQSVSKWRARGNVMLLIRDENRRAKGFYEVNMFKLDSVDLYRQEFRCWYSVNEEMISWDPLKDAKEDLRAYFEEFTLLNAPYFEDIATAGYDLRFLFYNSSLSDSLSLFFPNQEIRDIIAHGNRLVLADDAFMQRYMLRYAQNIKMLVAVQGEENEDVLDMDAFFENGYTNIVFTVVDDSPFLELPPQEVELLRQSVLPVLKQKIFSAEDGPEIVGDTVVTPEIFYRYMKGFRYFYIGEKSRKTIEMTLPIEEVMAASDMEMPADEDYETQIARSYGEEQYKQMVREFAASCPVISGAVVFTNATYQDSDKMLHLYVQTEAIDNPAGVKEVITKLLHAADDAPIFTSLVPLDAGTTLHLQTKDTLIDIVYSSDELKSIFEEPADEESKRMIKLEALKQVVQKANQEFPVETENLVIDSLSLTEEHLITHYTVKAEFADQFFLNDNGFLKGHLQSAYENPDDQTASFMELCCSAGIGICHCFTEPKKYMAGKKAKKKQHFPRVRMVCFSAEEIRAILNAE